MRNSLSKVVAIIVGLIGLGILGVGVAFVVIGATNQADLTTAMQQENITLGIEQTAIQQGQVIDTMSEARIAGDTIRGHRQGIAATYGDLLGGEQFDPNDPEQLTYGQALNLESYLYLAVLGFGLAQVAIASGAAMIAAGIAFILLALWLLLRRRPAEALPVEVTG